MPSIWLAAAIASLTAAGASLGAAAVPSVRMRAVWPGTVASVPRLMAGQGTIVATGAATVHAHLPTFG